MMYDFICSVPAPVKPCKKLYCSDESYAVPRSTLYRWKSNKSRKSLTFGEVRGTVLTSKFLELETMLSLIHISEPTRPLYISYAVFCLKKRFF